MYLSDHLVFVDLPKTASSHVRRLLAALEPGRELGVHVRPGRRLRRSGRAFWGTVRNPWDWYVSLWAYGCEGQGALRATLTTDRGWLRGQGWKHAPLRAAGALLRSALTQPRRHRTAWRECYGDVQDPGRFRRWLNMIHDPAFAADLGDGYAASGLHRHHGLLSWRYFRLYCDALPDGRMNSVELDAFDDRHCYITHFLRTDRLEDDLAEAFAELGRPLDANTRRELGMGRPTNPSSRTHGAGHYYDPDSIEQVAARDGLVVKKFGFTPPAL